MLGDAIASKKGESKKLVQRKLEVGNLLVEQRLEDALLLLHVLVKVLQELVDLPCRLNMIKKTTEIKTTNWCAKIV